MSRHVMLVSPTTLAGVLFTYLGSTRDFYRSQNMEEIEKRISKLELDAARLCERTEKETAQIETALKTARQSEYSARKLADRIKQISSGDPRL
jgi:DNA anti-recombination protein RmuC